MNIICTLYLLLGRSRVMEDQSSGHRTAVTKIRSRICVP